MKNKETLEEAAESYVKNFAPSVKSAREIGFIDGAKYQAERMYSEEYMLKFAWFLKENLGQYSCDKTAHFEGKYLEQFKNK